VAYLSYISILRFHVGFFKIFYVDFLRDFVILEQISCFFERFYVDL